MKFTEEKLEQTFAELLDWKSVQVNSNQET
jgi:hypothetical protein